MHTKWSIKFLHFNVEEMKREFLISKWNILKERNGRTSS